MEYIISDTRLKNKSPCKDCIRLAKKYNLKNSLDDLDDLPETNLYKENNNLWNKHNNIQRELRYSFLLEKNKHYNNIINEMYVDKSKNCCDCMQPIKKGELAILHCGHYMDMECMLKNTHFINEYSTDKLYYYTYCPKVGWEGINKHCPSYEYEK